MSIYFISDIHGCYKEFKLLLKKSFFNDKKDFLWIAGDLVSRGPDSLKVIRYLYSLRKRIKIILGNHDLNLIAVYSGVKENKKENYFDEFLSAKDNLQLINWLRCQSILKIDEERKIIMSHAGISPKWDIDTAKKYALEIEKCLSGKNYSSFLRSVFNNKINYWNLNLNKLDRLRYSINVFTRMRYCYPDSRLNLICKKSPNLVKYPLIPWFKIPNKIPKEYSVFFGHWSSLIGTKVPQPFFPLDSGCCWGGKLTMFRWEDKKYFFQSFQKNNS
ncbi:symmetrical bis(5'-nucleosyl)-tetraphosphatase [Buchnera aphidicola]|jgi:bis(5'-nucleosyl)-tetraphosphatase (symmetrical)|uniref:Bis(5'-nucleosyl)-tetraphosphatase, symmetrical n=1 Tax=Buchnera aphidicola subsp. Schizaphis graminum (strain Sg) TaxID=198804 RepID=APAH_BUCAP|nr:symmetrical bis(5'-nucleosyl)-tetraphosphatase [Buchnera aphidicola]Q8K9Z9.1 RecName: Full=Bis(5'-nucleosyl)-tetraphosphatase, symmetrical; AltName: Full=Ap4A hydrolase; AltName: Full=Diadenosine 5',5'''-P1,P4-tetraphosphate pyrophosphohydrolase; AltName: Full=Diadenosine tetraphosphatase [Buchnera aphidicola str. Sg (Schizaphis graminum)]AAM67703.1 bis(5'-nucleosyl)-tetraphosphatase [Buchnera aphidicola str. Sg (Schizaphis graminum)]AWI49800.1 symmetrical bis(5'-nucleosyl)-tetraphosphatase [